MCVMTKLLTFAPSAPNSLTVNSLIGFQRMSQTL